MDDDKKFANILLDNIAADNGDCSMASETIRTKKLGILGKYSAGVLLTLETIHLITEGTKTPTVQNTVVTVAVGVAAVVTIIWGRLSMPHAEEYPDI